MNKKLPLFYFTPTICWVDDNKLFLDAASALFNDNYHCLTFLDSEEACQFLTSYQSPSSQISLIRELTENDIYGTPNHVPINLDISEITKLAGISRVQGEITILVIDNNMPKLNGIKLCQQLKNTSFKKILLTGETSPSEVINAFNSGIIDKFIAKDEHISEKLQAQIMELSYYYFYEKTKNLISLLNLSRQSPFSDPIFIDFFYNWFEENQFKEFYLINKEGSFLVRDNDGTAHLLIVMSESAIADFLRMNDEAMDIAGELLDQVACGILIPFFGIGKEYWEFNYTEWDKYFYPAKVIHGNEKYYWAVINRVEI